jgi:methylisocitrate lyase
MDQLQTEPGRLLRSVFDESGCIAMPGAFNGLCARAIADAGFRACYVSGAATSVCAGVPDIGVLTLEHFCRVIREVAAAATTATGPLPVIADADTGFGEAEMVRKTVIEYHRAGAAGLHLEDQEFPKRCGHLDGKELVPVDHMVEKVQWAANASRDCSGGNFIVCARTDARGVEGIDAAILRSAEYVRAGAEMIFPEGLTTESEFEQFAREMAKLPSPAGRRRGTGPYLLANMTEFGKTPLIPVDRFAPMGYSCVIFPVSMLRAAMGAVMRSLAELKKTGSVATVIDQMQTRADLYALIRYTPGKPWEFPG